MNTSELIDKLIPLLESAGEGAFWLALILIAQPYFTALIVAVVITIIATTIYRAAATFSSFARLAKSARTAARLSNWGNVTAVEEAAILRLIEAGRRAEQA